MHTTSGDSVNIEGGVVGALILQLRFKSDIHFSIMGWGIYYQKSNAVIKGQVAVRAEQGRKPARVHERDRQGSCCPLDCAEGVIRDGVEEEVLLANVVPEDYLVRGLDGVRDLLRSRALGDGLVEPVETLCEVLNGLQLEAVWILFHGV